MLAQYLLPAFAVLSVAAAQSSTCTSSTFTVNTPADATNLATCSTIKGSVLIGPSATDTIDLSGPQQITGDLICANATNLVTLKSSTIGSIGGTFNLNGLTLISTLKMDALTSVGAINWVALPALSQLSFGSTVSQAKSVVISNTFLSTLEGINLDTVATIQIDNNNRLKTFSTQVANITSNLMIFANGQQLNVSFPNLIWAANMTFRAIEEIHIPSLAVVNGSLGFYDSFVSSINAPNLTAVGNTGTGQGSLAFVDNVLLTNITMPLLASVGGADQIANNTLLGGISFAALENVGGAIDFSGNFTTPILPALVNIKGGFNIQSQQAINCDSFKAEAGTGKVIQGKYFCQGTIADVGGLGSTPTSTGSGSKPTKNAASPFGVSAAAAGLGVVGGILQLL